MKKHVFNAGRSDFSVLLVAVNYLLTSVLTYGSGPFTMSRGLVFPHIIPVTICCHVIKQFSFNAREKKSGNCYCLSV